MKYFYIATGSLSLALGILGIFLPLLPTTPFLLLTAGLYMKSSPRLYGWLLCHPHLGPYIYNYRHKNAITLPAKIVSLGLLWATLSFCIFFVVDTLWVRALLVLVLAGVTGHILSFRTMKKDEATRFARVKCRREAEDVSRMAHDIWQEHYSSILPGPQIGYMLRTMQSANAIQEQISGQGYEYYIIRAGGQNAGYMALKPANGKMCLSKLYIYAHQRGKGYATEALSFAENLCRSRKCNELWLTVNRHNSQSIEIYKKRGFAITREEIADIGGGFVMDDYIMSKQSGGRIDKLEGDKRR